MQALQILQADRSGSFETLRVLAEVIPSDTWLSQFKIEGQAGKFTGQLSGASLTYQSVSDFMRRLEETPQFMDIQLKSTKQDSTATMGLHQRATFELQFKRRELGGSQ